MSELKPVIVYTEEEVKEILIKRNAEFSSNNEKFRDLLLKKDLEFFESIKKKPSKSLLDLSNEDVIGITKNIHPIADKIEVLGRFGVSESLRNDFILSFQQRREFIIEVKISNLCDFEGSYRTLVFHITGEKLHFEEYFGEKENTRKELFHLNQNHYLGYLELLRLGYILSDDSLRF